MILTVNRIASDADATLSTVSVDGRFICFGLEDEYRETKVAGETRIPSGMYKISLRTVGGFHGRYSKKFPDFHRGMLWVRDVPGFEYILIHIGNTDKNTDGCLLVGEGATTSGEIRVTNSTTAYRKLYLAVINAAQNDDLYVEYVDSDFNHNFNLICPSTGNPPLRGHPNEYDYGPTHNREKYEIEAAQSG